MKKIYVLSKFINFLAKVLFVKKPIKVRKRVCELKRIPVKKNIRHVIINSICRRFYKNEPYHEQDIVFLHQKDFVVFDDFFPDAKSGWRYVEIDAYLKKIPRSACCTSGESLKLMEHISDFDFKSMFSDEISAYNHQGGNSVFLYEGAFKTDKPFLAYCIFINNIFAFDFLSSIKMPFVFTLYPGGGMTLNTSECDRMLSAVFRSKYFRHVIVTQRVTYDYLIEKKLCPAEKMTFIFGGPSLEKMQRNVDASLLKKFGRDKDILDICFASNRYSEFGEDKGYDVFIKMAAKLYRRHNNIRFHVVGNGFDEKTLNVAELQSAISFYGLQSPDFFLKFYQDKDIICSPNKPFIQAPGRYDGFPLGTSCDAMSQHVACFMSDELKCNQGRYVDKVDAEILPPDADAYVERIEYYMDNPSKLIEMAENGAKKVRQLYNYEAQVVPRMDLMKKLIKEEGIAV